MTDRPKGGVDGARPPKRQRRKARRWNKLRRTRFLESLAETCNVSAAARAAGMDRSSAYDLKERDKGFARGWGMALARAHADLEWWLLEQAKAGRIRTEMSFDPKTKAPTHVKLVHDNPLTVAVRLFLAHKAEAQAARAVPAAEPEPDEMEKTRAVLALVDARLKASEEEAAGRRSERGA